jgi:uncharacterized protein (DUF1015 family)
MPEIQAFQGIRYNLGHVGSLSDVTAPPYDVISPELQAQLYKKHPANVVRLILNRDEPGDDDHNNRYTRAARFLRDWQGQGLLFSEPDPAIYVYHQEFKLGGQTLCRRGFMARVRLARFGQGQIYPHEETMAGPKADRLRLTQACRANLSQVFGLYPDPQAECQQILEQAIAGQTPLDAVDHLGVLHRLWPVSSTPVIAAISAAVSEKPVFIADGHHRYETACNYRDLLAAAGPLAPRHPANYVLMMLVGMSDPGMVVFPTHRLFRGLPAMSSAELASRLGECFTCQAGGEGSAAAHTLWEEMELEENQGTFGLYTSADRRWTLARLTPAGAARMAQAAAEHSSAWQGLGVAILHRLLIETLLGARELPKPTYVHLIDEVVDELTRQDYPLAALVLAPRLDQIQAVSQTLERMPAKSTYFYPKLLSGLVINPLE